MAARPKLAPEDQMTVEEFLGFTSTRPDEERWELIEGVPILNASPVNVHQIVVTNIVSYLMARKAQMGASWLPLVGTGMRVPISSNSLPEPDAYVQEGPANWEAANDEALVIFEVLSKSNTKADQAWRRRVYASVPNCQHYVTVSLKGPEVTVYDRSTGWRERTATGIGSRLDLPAIGVELPLADVYRYTPLAE